MNDQTKTVIWQTIIIFAFLLIAVSFLTITDPAGYRQLIEQDNKIIAAIGQTNTELGKYSNSVKRSIEDIKTGLGEITDITTRAKKAIDELTTGNRELIAENQRIIDELGKAGEILSGITSEVDGIEGVNLQIREEIGKYKAGACME